MSQAQQQQQPEKVSDEPLTVNETTALYQLLNIGYNKAAYGIDDAFAVWSLNRRLRAILDRAAQNATAAPAVVKKKKSKVVVEDADADSDDDMPQPQLVK